MPPRLARLAWAVLLAMVLTPAPGVAATACPPSSADMLGPFYVAGAPERARTGEGLTVQGAVRSTRECAPLAGAKIEWWSANRQGQYDDAHRATQVSGAAGAFRYVTDVPGKYPGRPVHLHVRVSAPGHKTLVSQVYPKPNQSDVAIDFVLLPE